MWNIYFLQSISSVFRDGWIGVEDGYSLVDVFNGYNRINVNDGDKNCSRNDKDRKNCEDLKKRIVIEKRRRQR